MKNIIEQLKELKTYIVLWITQSLSTLGSSMTGFALIVWSYEQQGSALTTAMLSICSYAPYVVFSFFAGAVSDRWNKKYTMLVCDSFAAIVTMVILVLLKSNHLEIWHLYLLNALNGLMNTVQQPAGDVTVSLLVEEKHYQKVSGMRSLSNAIISILTPACATAVFAFAGLDAVIGFDLVTFVIAFVILAFFIPIPRSKREGEEKQSVLMSSREGISYLVRNRGVLDLILFLAAINFTASMYEAALPAMILSRPGGGRVALGLVNICVGVANCVGSIAVSFSRAPKSRVRVICAALLFSMSTENLFLAFGKNTVIWCAGAVLGWIFIPVMGANLDVLLRTNIPIAMQGRVFAARNAMQFFTIPLGYLAGGIMVDKVCEPLMASQKAGSLLTIAFGTGKGSGAAFLFLLLYLMGVVTCLIFPRSKHIWKLEKTG